jgi:ABC-type lipoprotein release transport system permease subunit
MGLVVLRLRSELRAQWRAVVALSLVVGIGGGVALAAFAGARRTDTAVPRFMARYEPDDGGFLYGNVFKPPVPPGRAAYSLAPAPVEQRVLDLPQVAAWFRAPYLFLSDSPNGGQGSLNPIGAADAALLHTVDRPLVLAGRLPDPAQPFDAAINQLAATTRHLRVGSMVRLYAYSASQVEGGDLTSGTAPSQAPRGPTFTVRVTAIVRFPNDVNAVIPIAAKQDVSYEGQQNVYLTPAFLLRLADGLGIPVQRLPSLNLVAVRLRRGAADWPAFASAVTATGHGQITASPGDVNGARTAAASAQRGVHLEVVALLLMGAGAALVTLVLVGQAIARRARVHAADYATMRALGATPNQVRAVVLLRAALIALSGAAVAFVIAVLASPFTPIGLARQAEVHPGLEINIALLLLGCIALVVLVTASSLPVARRVSRAATSDERAAEHPSRLAGAVLRAPLPAPAAMGIRFGFGREAGATTAPVAPAVTGAVLAVAAFVCAITFGRSLEHLVATPRQQGWNWDVLVGNPNDQTDREAQAGRLLARNPDVAAYSAIAIIAGDNQGTAVIDGKTIDAVLAFDPMKGNVYPPLLEGHAPQSGDEIVLGTQTMHRLHKRVGDTVQVPTPAGNHTLHIVGRMISPSVGDLFTNGLGDGAWIYGPVVRQMQSQVPQQDNGLPPTVFVLFAVRYAPGVPPAAAYASLRHDFGRTVLRPLPSEDAVNLKSVDRLPLLLAALIVLIGIVTVGNALVSSVRRRRRDLAVLKIMGFERRQVLATVFSQAAALAVIAGVLGVALGVAAGRFLWHVVASNLSSVSPALVPAAATAAVVPIAVAVSVLIAALPGWSAARLQPAVVLRRE